MRIYKNAWFARFSRREKIADHALRDAVRRIEEGQIDADLGGGVLKQRIARTGGGKSGGYRTIVLFRKGGRAVFVYGFAKSGRANINQDELAEFKKAAKLILALSLDQMTALIEDGGWVEVTQDDAQVS